MLTLYSASSDALMTKTPSLGQKVSRITMSSCRL